MYIEFNDGSQLECIRILGGPRVIGGITRDCLSIEFNPDNIILEELIGYFSDPDKLIHLYTRELPGSLSPKQEIGEGYLYAVNISTISRKDTHVPGLMVEDTFTLIRIVEIAQLTYEEYQLWKAGEYTPPSFFDIDE